MRSRVAPAWSVMVAHASGLRADDAQRRRVQRCGATYYRAAMQGNTLVFVVSQP
jgi:hypothetical protein